MDGPSASSRRVIVVGAINVDFVVAAPSLPAPGETVVGDGMVAYGGGKGANAAVAAARAGGAVSLVGAVGADSTGRDALAELVASGVDVTHVAVLGDRPTGVALIVVDEAGENQIAVGAGANAAVTPESVTAALTSLLPQAGCVLVSAEIPAPAVVAAVRAAADAGVACVLNPAPVTPGLAEALDLGPIVTPNRGELAALLGAASVDAEAAAIELATRTGAAVVVTLGGDGALVVDHGVAVHVPAVPVVAVDTTGAGDAFNGVLAASLAGGVALHEAVQRAAAAAADAVTRPGARG